MPSIQKILIIIGFVISVIFIGWFIIIVFFKPFVPPDDGAEITNTNGSLLTPADEGLDPRTLPEGVQRLPGQEVTNVNVSVSTTPSPSPLISNIARGGLTKTTVLSSPGSFSPTLSQDGSNVVYYDSVREQFVRVSNDGTENLVSEKKFPEVQNIRWSPKKSSAILEFPDGANIYFDFSQDRQITLPRHWEQFDFSPSGQELIAKSLGLSRDNRYLIVTDPEGKQARIISGLPENDSTVIPSWSPNNQTIGMVVQNDGADTKKILFIGQNNENFLPLTVDGLGFQGNWTPDGDRLVYSIHSTRTDSKPELWVVDATPDNMGRNRKNIGLQTWPDKCSFENGYVMYCAVPNSLETGAGFFRNELDNSPDTLYRVDLNSGAKSIVAIPDGSHNMQNLVTSQDGRFLYYVNAFDGRLYSIRLK